MSSGRIVEIIGAVIDVEFNREDVPKVYDALTVNQNGLTLDCLLYTSPSPRDRVLSRMPSSA